MLSLTHRIEISPFIVIASNKDDMFWDILGPPSVVLIVDCEVEQILVTSFEHLNSARQAVLSYALNSFPLNSQFSKTIKGPILICSVNFNFVSFY